MNSVTNISNYNNGEFNNNNDTVECHIGNESISPSTKFCLK